MTAVDAAKRMAQANFEKVKNGSANALVALAVRNFDDAAIDAHAGNAADPPTIYAKYWFALLLLRHIASSALLAKDAQLLLAFQTANQKQQATHGLMEKVMARLKDQDRAEDGSINSLHDRMRALRDNGMTAHEPRRTGPSHNPKAASVSAIPSSTAHAFVPVSSLGPPSPSSTAYASNIRRSSAVYVPHSSNLSASTEPNVRSELDFTQSFPSIDEIEAAFPSVPSALPSSATVSNLQPATSARSSRSHSVASSSRGSFNPPPSSTSSASSSPAFDNSHALPTITAAQPPSQPTPSPVLSATSVPPSAPPQYTSARTSTSAPPPKLRRPELPKSEPYSPKHVRQVLDSNLKVMLIDVRTREEFDQCHLRVDAGDPLVCIEPSILMRDHREVVTGATIEAALVIGPSAESAVFRNRSKFDSVILYDADSMELAPGTPIARLFRAIYDDETPHKRTKVAPYLLQGGIKAWQEEFGSAGVASTTKGTTTPSTASSSNGRNMGPPPDVPRHTKPAAPGGPSLENPPPPRSSAIMSPDIVSVPTTLAMTSAGQSQSRPSPDPVPSRSRPPSTVFSASDLVKPTSSPPVIPPPITTMPFPSTAGPMGPPPPPTQPPTQYQSLTNGHSAYSVQQRPQSHSREPSASRGKVEYPVALASPPAGQTNGTNGYIQQQGVMQTHAIEHVHQHVPGVQYAQPVPVVAAPQPTPISTQITGQSNGSGAPDSPVRTLNRKPAISRPPSAGPMSAYRRPIADVQVSSPTTTGSSIQYPSPVRSFAHHTHNASTSSLASTSAGDVQPPPIASVTNSPLARRRSDYIDSQAQMPVYAGGAPTSSTSPNGTNTTRTNGKAIDYPQLAFIRPPPPAAAPLQRQDQRPLGATSMSAQNTGAGAAVSQGLNGAPLPPKPPLILSDYPVTSWSDMTVATSGLKNLGNTCYMNATIQCLSATVPFARFFTEGRWKSAVNTINPLGTKGQLAGAFAQLLHEMWHGDLPYRSPYTFRKAVCASSKEFANSDQHDSQEFLSALLDGLHEDLNRVLAKPTAPTPTPEREAELETLSVQIASEQEWQIYQMRNDSLVVDYFQGQFRNRVECLTCRKTSTTYNSFMYLSLPIPTGRGLGKITLKDCLDYFTREEVIDKDNAWHCPNCKCARRATTRMTLARLPPVLLIHLKRFSIKGPFTDKLESTVDFPVRGLDLTNYMPPPLPPGVARPPRPGPPLRADDPRLPAPPYRYDLYGVTNHYGTLTGGHYTAFIASRGTWLHCDDSRITEADPSALTSRAYVLFYRRAM